MSSEARTVPPPPTRPAPWRRSLWQVAALNAAVPVAVVATNPGLFAVEHPLALALTAGGALGHGWSTWRGLRHARDGAAAPKPPRTVWVPVLAADAVLYAGVAVGVAAALPL